MSVETPDLRTTRAVRIGQVPLGQDVLPVVIGGSAAAAGPGGSPGPAQDIRWITLRGHRGRRPAGEAIAEARAGWASPVLVEPFSAADLPDIAEQADGVVIGAAWMQDFRLVRAAARLGIPVVVQRGPAATLEEWLAIADYCVAEGNDQVALCECGSRTPMPGGGTTLDLAMAREARARTGRPVLVALGRDAALAGAAIAAGADGLMLAPDAGRDVVAAAREAAIVVGAMVRREDPATVAEARGVIDRVDAALATLLERRAELAGVVQRLKPVGGFAGRDMERERSLVAAMARRAPALGTDRLAPVMNAVIEAGLHLAEERRARPDGG
ncbi:chorismate mutase [Spongiactinospora gelatinilytica]|uniref:chorismate mutase n=1 Tax=Spongiactinospora gelatinilytica TaxID=2666298 RepID=UPI0027BAC87C|nr:chorismate mutase [Spongiactinospora gelatinilytica]